MNSEDASDCKARTDQDIFDNAFDDICVDKDSNTLDLTHFICGLLKFGINTLSNKEMENIFNFMNANNQSTINKNEFINFLSANIETNEQYCHLQHILIDKIHSAYNKNVLTLSSFFEFSYIPLKPSSDICNEYETEIEDLKSKLQRAMNTLEYNNDLNDGIIPMTMPNVSALSSSQSIETIPESLIYSSLEPTTNYNPFEWNINDVIDWLQMIDLSHYTEICKIRQINGNKLLGWSREEFVSNLQFENDHDIDKFIQEIDILKETTAPIDDLYGVSESESSISTGMVDTNNSMINVNGLEEIRNVTNHTFSPPKTVEEDEMISMEINERDEMHNAEIDKLKTEIQRIELSKLKLIVSTSAELQKLRDIIKQYT